MSGNGREALLCILAVLSGITDAFGYVHLGGAFASVMTGNIVIFGLSLSLGHWGQVLRTAAAIVCFATGCSAGGRIAGPANDGDVLWPRSINQALAVELLLFTIYSGGWIAFGRHPGNSAATAMLCASALALGVQSGAIQRFGIKGLSTTYLTGTLTTMMLELAHTGRVRESVRNLRLLGALVVGAATGAVTSRDLNSIAPLIPPLLVGTVLAAGSTAKLRSSGPTDDMRKTTA